MAFFISIFVLLADGILSPQYSDLNIIDIGFSRLFCTLLGIIILVFFELILFPKSTRTRFTVIPMIECAVKNSINNVNDIVYSYSCGRELKKEFQQYLDMVSASVLNIEKMFVTAEHEIYYNPENFNKFKRMNKHLFQMQDKLRCMAFICNNNKNNRLEPNSMLLDLSNLVQEYDSISPNEGILKYIFSNNDLKNKISIYDKESFEYKFILKLYKFFWHLDQLRKNLYLVKQNS